MLFLTTIDSSFIDFCAIQNMTVMLEIYIWCVRAACLCRHGIINNQVLSKLKMSQKLGIYNRDVPRF